MASQSTADAQSTNSSSRSITIPSSTSRLNEEFTIRVLTLNCWGLWLWAKKRRQRITGIIRYLRENNCDIVFLQEVWVTSDFEKIRDGTKDIYRFAHLFRSGSVLGSSGIVILCKWLPKIIHFEPYSLNGSPFYPWHGDWFAGKGIAYSRVDFNGLSLHLFSTHTHAYYQENEPVNDQYSVHRVCQSYQLARFITFICDTASVGKTNGKDLLIFAGDMNSTSSELPYKILTSIAGLTDCFKTPRYNSSNSNIIHKHKLTSLRQRLEISTNGINDPKNQCDKVNIGFCRNILGESSNSILNTLSDYRSLIVQYFDSDTDDDDITYCHPKNSFTPSSIEYKSIKPPQPLYKSSGPDANVQSKCSTNGGDSLELSSVKQEGKCENNCPVDSPTKLPRSKKSPMKRIDFILCRLLTHGHCVVDRVVTENKDLALDCSLSDHEPVMVEMTISDVSHDLVKKNHAYTLNNNDNLHENGEKITCEHSRPLASLIEPESSADGNKLEETTNKWVPEEATVNSYQKFNVQVLEETLKILLQYYQNNKTSKKRLFYSFLLLLVLALPASTYYSLSEQLLPVSILIILWLATSFLFASGVLIGFLCYRFEQGAIEAILNDITCKISVARDHMQQERFETTN